MVRCSHLACTLCPRPETPHRPKSPQSSQLHNLKATEIGPHSIVQFCQLLALVLRVENELKFELIQSYHRSQVLGRVWVVRGGRKGQINRQFERSLNHVRDYAGQQWTDTLETWVGVDLDEPGLEVAVDHEVQSVYFEVIHLVSGRNLGRHTPSGVSSHFLHFRQDLFLEAVLLAARVQIALELVVGDLVGRFIAAVVGEVLLDGVIGEVDFRREVVDVELVGRSADVALVVPVGTRDPEEVGN